VQRLLLLRVPRPALLPATERRAAAAAAAAAGIPAATAAGSSRRCLRRRQTLLKVQQFAVTRASSASRPALCAATDGFSSSG